MDLTIEQNTYYQNLVEFISMIQGKNSDVVLSNLSEHDFPIEFIRNGSILDARKKDSTPDFVKIRIDQATATPNKQYHEQFNLKHKTLNISVVIFEAADTPKVALSIITDVTPFITALRANANLAKLYQLNTDAIDNLSSDISMARRGQADSDLSFSEKIHEMVREKSIKLF